MPTLSEEPQLLLILPTFNDYFEDNAHKSFAPAYSLNILATAFQHVGITALVLDEFSLQIGHDFAECTSWIEATITLLDRFPSIKMIGLSVLTNFRQEVVTLSREVKRYKPEITVVWGGPHVTALGKMLRDRFSSTCDVMVLGPVDTDIIQHLADMVKANWRPSSTVMLRSRTDKDIARTICPTYSHYLTPLTLPIPKLAVRTTSSCPTPGCIFCSARFLEGSFLCHDDEMAHQRIDSALALRPAKLEFHDQDFLFDLARLARILPVSISQLSQGYCHAGVNTVAPEHVDLLNKTGIDWTVFIGLETASPRLSRYIGKRHQDETSLKRLLEVINYTDGSRVRFGAFLLLGIPGEEQLDIDLTIEFLEQAKNLDVCCTLMKVFPGTALATKLLRSGMISHDIWLDENGPRNVAAVQGDALQWAMEKWQQILELFPSAQQHQTIDRELFGLHKNR